MPSDDVTFRLSLSDPKSVDMTYIQHSLEEAGFQVTTDGRRGFMLSGKASLVEAFFHTAISREGDELSFSLDASNNTVLDDISFRIYFPKRPDYFP